MRFSLLISALALSGLVLAGCASAPGDTPVEFAAPQGVSVEDATEGFRVAVIDACLTALESGKPISELANETGPITADEQYALQARMKPGSTAWAPKRGKGNVSIVSSGSTCEVHAFGPPVKPAFERVSQALLDPHGFSPDTATRDPSPQVYYQPFTKKLGAKTIKVILSGNDPGAPGTKSRFSTLTASVTAS